MTGFRAASLQHAPRDSVGQGHRIEVDQQTNLVVAEPEIGQHLALMHWQYAFDRFDFQDDLLFHNNIGDIAAIEANTFVDQRNWHLTTKHDAGTVEFVAQACFISCLKQTRAEATMYAHRQADDLVCEVAVVHEAGLHGARFTSDWLMKH